MTIITHPWVSKKFHRNENCNSPSRSCSISVFILKLRISCTKTETSKYLNQFKARYYVFSPNAGKYRPENFQIRTLFTQWYSDDPSQPPSVILGGGVILKNCRNRSLKKWQKYTGRLIYSKHATFKRLWTLDNKWIIKESPLWRLFSLYFNKIKFAFKVKSVMFAE